MIVARSRLPADTLDLRVGDEVLGLGAPTQDFATVTDLMDALRGHLDPVTLRVRRDGRDRH